MQKILLLLFCGVFCALQAAAQPETFIEAPKTLTLTNIPQIEKSLADEVKKYISAKTFFLSDSNAAGILFSSYGEINFTDALPGAAGAPVVTKLVGRYPDVPQIVYLSPNGKSVVFTKALNGNDQFNLFILDVLTKSARGLIRLSPDEYVRDVRWSADSESVIYVQANKKTNRGEIRQLSVTIYPAQPKTLVELPGLFWTILAATPEAILLSEYADSKVSNTYELRPLSGASPPQAQKLDLLKDAFAAEYDGAGQIWFAKYGDSYISLYSPKKKKIRRFDFPNKFAIDGLVFSPSKSLLAARELDKGNNRIGVFAVGKRRLQAVDDDILKHPAVIGKFSWRGDDHLMFSAQSATNPGSVYDFDTKSKVNRAWLAGDSSGQTAEAKAIEWKSFDRRTISGFMYEPLAAKTVKEGQQQKSPVIIDIHGGPQSLSQPRYQWRENYLVEKLGYTIIYPNVRGSYGFGDEFSDLDDGAKRVDAVKDVQALIDWIQTQPNLDSKRIFLRGASYGGFLALAVGLREQERVRGVLTQVPIISIKNYLAFRLFSPALVTEYGDPKNTQLTSELDKLSLLDNASSWKLPVLLAIGAKDRRVGTEDMYKLKSQLEKAGVPVWSLEADDEGHGLVNNSDFLFYATVKFLQQFG